MTEAAMATDEMEPETKQPRRCPGNGVEPCNVPPELVGESGYCLPHDPARGADRAANAVLGGVKAGAKRRKGLDPDQLGKLETPEDAMRWTKRLALAVATGELSSAQARTCLVAIAEWRKAYEADVVAKQIAELQRAARDRRR